jgi:glyoxylase-like metal-dependent hydrolase (beta-lactamase superfamily II)
MRVHVVQTGRIFFKPALVDGDTRLGALRGFFQKERVEIPMLGWLVEHPDGHVVLDSGAHHQIVHMLPRFFRRLAIFEMTPEDEMGPQLRRRGLRPDDVALVIPTHLDVDHAGGISHFPNARFLVHRPEHAYASTFAGKQRFAPRLWPEWFAPTLYDLQPEPFGPFPSSFKVAERRDVTIVPTYGHSVAHVGIVIKSHDVSLFFAGDHMLTQDWFIRDVKRRRYAHSVHFHSRREAIQTSKRIAEFIKQTPTILVPSHDSTADARIAANGPLATLEG